MLSLNLAFNILSASDYRDYQRQFPGRTITFKQTMGKAHDRFIVLDYGTKDERVFHCGPSSKDAGNKLAAVTEFSDGDVKKAMHDGVMLNKPYNPEELENSLWLSDESLFTRPRMSTVG